MRAIKDISLSAKITFAIIACIILFATCINNEKKEQPAGPGETKPVTLKKPRYDVYAGSEKCASCHREIYEKHTATSHFLSSLPANEKTIKGSFKKGKNVFSYNPDLYVEMQKRDSGLFQVVYYKGEEKMVIPFDIIVGSGTKGQSFIYWRDNRLFQMPLTYFTIGGQWANSPGFPSKVQFDRPITSRCLECHSTFAEVITPYGNEPEEFNHQKIILGVGCEKCHGPGKKHIDFHVQDPNEKKPMFIVNPASLTRKQQLDICALCHGGRKQKIQPSFTFEPGDTLENFFLPGNISYGTADVHGNQLALLASSKCFKMSGNMTCNTCHNPHENERGKLALFSQRCINCHSEPHKQIPGKNITVSTIKQNCIDCHMPTQSSNSIVLMTGQGQQKAAKFRSHFISIYNNFQDSIHKSFKN